MEFEDIHPGEVLRYTQSGSLYFVKNTLSGKLFLDTEEGTEAIFNFAGQFERASDDELRRVLDARKKRKRMTRKTGGRKYNEDDTKAAFDKYIERLKTESPQVTEPFLAFWNKALENIGGKPGQTWRMRESKVSGLNPVIRVPSGPDRGGLIDGLLVFANSKEASALGLAIKRSLLPKEADRLFPEKKTMMGQWDRVDLPYTILNDSVLKPYLDCIQEISGTK